MMTIYDLVGVVLDEPRPRPPRAAYRSSTPGRMRDGRGVTVYSYDTTRLDDVAVSTLGPWEEVVAATERLAGELDRLPGVTTTVLLSPKGGPRHSPHGRAIVRVERTTG